MPTSRALLRQLILLCVVLASGACERPAASALPRTPRGEFRVLLPSRPLSLNPYVELDESALVVARSIFNQLLTINESGRLLPELAQSWTASADGLTYTFALRPGIRWHDGVPFSAEDVKWTMESVARESWTRDVMTHVREIEAVNATTVVFRLHYVWAPFPSEIASLGMMILPRHIYGGSEWRNHAANLKPIGTGAFRFAEWRDDGTVELDANPNHFRHGPFVQRLTFQTGPSSEVYQRLLKGDSDYSVTRLLARDLTALPPDGPVVVRTLPTSARYYLTFNLRRPPFSDVRVRRAVASALDRLALLRASLAGRGAPAVGWYTPDVEWAYNPAARVPDLNPGEARRLLDAAGLRPRRRGERLRATLVVADSPPLSSLADVIRDQLGALGVTIDVVRMSPSEWPRRVMSDRDFDLSVFSGAQGPDPDALRERFAAGGPGAFIGYESPAFAAAVERGARTIDLTQRAEAYFEAQEILARDVPFVPLIETVKIVAFHRRVAGLPQLEARGLVGGFDFSLVRLRTTSGETAP